MRTRSLPVTLFPLLCLAALTFGCSDDTSVDDGNSTTAASGSDTSSQTETESGNTTDPTTTTASDTSTTNAENTFISEEGPDTTADTGGLGNLGDMCTTDEECAEDLFCNGVVGLAAVCSECGSDADCPDGGNCTFSGAYFACGDGSQGQMCETDASCGEGLFCAEVVNLGGLFNGNFCSECKVDTDCADGQLCAPQIEFMDLMNIAGQRACIDPETAPNNQLCDADGSGDQQCEGYCTTADIMGLIEVGVCGDCETDAECSMGMTCTPAMVGLDGFAGSVCG